MSRARTRSRGVQSAGSDVGILEDDAEARLLAALSADLEGAADAAIDEIAHREAHVGLVRRDARGRQPITERGRIGGRVDVDAHHGAARQRDVVRCALSVGAAAARRLGVRGLDVEVGDAAAFANEERPPVLEPAVEMHHGPPILDAVRRLQHEAPHGRRHHCLRRTCVGTGALYHVTSRGNAREAIFLDDADRWRFLDTLGEVIERHRWVCHAYCLMTNHYHLLVETPEANLSRGMRHLNGCYTQRFNRRHGRVGHVLQGRYAAILIEREGHCLEVSRYVVLNPVRAGLVEAAERYRWSSLQATLGLAQAPAWLTTATILAAFGSRARYLEFVREGAAIRSPWASLRGPLLGSEAFVERLGPRLRERIAQPEIVRRERLVHRERLEALFPSSLVTDRRRRDDRIRQVASTHGYTLAEIGRHLGLHYSTVSRIARSLGVRS